MLGLAIYRQFGPPDRPGIVFFLGTGLLEVSDTSTAPPPANLAIWLQVRDVAAEHARLVEAGVDVVAPRRCEPWGLIEMTIQDPDGTRLILIQVPGDHPLRRDQR
ncbi:VOC family protein [Actinopolymorpha alba]|uniref:VOC family protein n=1 Tax=Actinopolymorpha alba TaxID=533267 RepID=UPI00037C1B67|nr:VOC family protein [Actinopolymorpha alba]